MYYFHFFTNTTLRFTLKGRYSYMSDEKMMNAYDDGNIPTIDLPPRGAKNNYPTDAQDNVEPLPESTRPRKDGPGGN